MTSLTIQSIMKKYIVFKNKFCKMVAFQTSVKLSNVISSLGNIFLFFHEEETQQQWISILLSGQHKWHICLWRAYSPEPIVAYMLSKGKVSPFPIPLSVCMSVSVSLCVYVCTHAHVCFLQKSKKYWVRFSSVYFSSIYLRNLLFKEKNQS